MNEHHDHDNLHTSEDANLDANLKAIGRTLKLPASPTPEQIAAWHTHAPISFSSASSAARRTPPRFRWLAAGSAVAATLGVGITVFLASPGSTVQASTILTSLRQKQVNGFNITLNKVAAEGVTFDGVIQVRARNPITIDQVGDHDPLTGGDFGAMHAKINITTDGTAEFLPNAEILGEAAFTREVGWAYLRAGDEAMRTIAKDIPQTAMLANMARNGLLLNIGPIDENLLKQLAPLCPDARNLDDLTDEQIASINEATEHFEKQTGKPSKRVTVEQTPDGKRHVTVKAGIQSDKSGVHPTLQITSDDAAIGGIARRMLNGSARQGELEQLKNLLINANQNVVVQNMGAGRYLLTADLTDPEHRQNGREATLTVSYEENGGVQWAEVSNMREASGTVRVDFVDDAIDPAQLDKARLITPGQTSYIDLNMLRMMFGAK